MRHTAKRLCTSKLRILFYRSDACKFMKKKKEDCAKSKKWKGAWIGNFFWNSFNLKKQFLKPIYGLIWNGAYRQFDELCWRLSCDLSADGKWLPSFSHFNLFTKQWLLEDQVQASWGGGCCFATAPMVEEKKSLWLICNQERDSIPVT